MATMPREVPVEVRLSVHPPEALEDGTPLLPALTAAAAISRVQANIAAYLAAEVEARVRAERDSYLLVLAHLAERYGEPSPTGGFTLHIPEAALLQDRPTVDAWTEPGRGLAEDGAVVYRVRRG